MGANDAAEMLEVAKAECLRLERENARLSEALSTERGHIQSLAKWVGVDESTESLGIACEVSAALESIGVGWEWGVSGDFEDGENWDGWASKNEAEARQEVANLNAEEATMDREMACVWTVQRRHATGPWLPVGGTE